MTAITPAYAHAYQLICLTGHIPVALPNARTRTRERGNDFQGGPSALTGVLALLMVNPWLDGVLRHDLPMEEKMSCLVQLSRLKPILYAIHSNNTAEMSGIIEALSFSRARGPVARDACSCVFYDSQHAAGVCLGTIHARTHVQLGLSCQQLLLKVQRRLRFTNTSTVTRRILETNARITPPHWVHLAWCRTLTFPHVGHVNHFDSVSCFDICHNLGDVLEKRVCLPPRTRPGVSALFHAVLRYVSLACIVVPRSSSLLNSLHFP